MVAASWASACTSAQPAVRTTLVAGIFARAVTAYGRGTPATPFHDANVAIPTDARTMTPVSAWSPKVGSASATSYGPATAPAELTSKRVVAIFTGGSPCARENAREFARV